MEKFKKTGKMQMITDVISFICFILSIMSVGISIMLIISKQYPYLIISLSAFAVFGIVIYFFRKKYNSNTEEGRYEFTLNKSISYEDMKNQLEIFSDKSYIHNESCSVYLFKEKGQEYRVLLYTTNNFNKKEYYSTRKRVNKEFNKKYSINSTGSASEISKRNFINIAFVNEYSESLDKMLNVPADDFINRASPLLSISVVDNTLYIPYYVGYHFASSSTYYKLCNKVFKLFGIRA